MRAEDGGGGYDGGVRAVAADWGRAGPEPSLDEVLADPIIHLLLRRDGLTPEDVRLAVRCRPGAGFSYRGAAGGCRKAA